MVSTRARRRTTMRVMTEYQRSTKAASSLAVLLALAGHAAAQQRPAAQQPPAGPARVSCAAQQALVVARSGARTILSPWGAFATIQGPHATATARTAGRGWPRKM